MAKFRLTLPRALASMSLLGLLSVQCNHSNCEELRDSLFAQKLSWQGCQTDLDCVLVGGNESDCTGVMSCNFAVNRSFRLDAERRVASLPEETVDCMECGAPNCERGMRVHCEPVSRLCIVITELEEVETGGSGN